MDRKTPRSKRIAPAKERYRYSASSSSPTPAPSNVTQPPVESKTKELKAFLETYDNPDNIPLCFQCEDKEMITEHRCELCPSVVLMQSKMPGASFKSIQFNLLFQFLPAEIVDMVREMCEMTRDDLRGEHAIDPGYRPPKWLAMNRYVRDQLSPAFYGKGSYFTFDDERCLFKWLKSLSPKSLNLLYDVRMVYFITVNPSNPAIHGSFKTWSDARDAAKDWHLRLGRQVARMGLQSFALKALHVEVHIADGSAPQQHPSEWHKWLYRPPHLKVLFGLLPAWMAMNFSDKHDIQKPPSTRAPGGRVADD